MKKQWMRVLALALSVVLSLTLLSGCKGARPLPDGMEEEPTGEAGRAIVALLVAEDYQAVADAFRADVREEYGVNADSVKAIMDTVAEAGAYVSTSQTLAVGGKNDAFDGEYAAVAVYCEHESKDVIYEMSFDTDLTLIGLAVKQK